MGSDEAWCAGYRGRVAVHVGGFATRWNTNFGSTPAPTAMNHRTHQRYPTNAQQGAGTSVTEVRTNATSGPERCNSGSRQPATLVSPSREPAASQRVSGDAPRSVKARHLLPRQAELEALKTLERFRVIRTIDVAVTCYPERTYKAALTAAQRTVRRLVKKDFIRRYRTDRFQTVYGLTKKGADWLDEHGVEASSSVRRVSDMTNPEHRLWLQFLVLCAQARGLRALTESELLAELNRGVTDLSKARQGYTTVLVQRAKGSTRRELRPDCVIFEEDGATWVEVDRSKRGSEREASLAALAGAIGRKAADEKIVRKVAVFCKTERIEQRALAVLRRLAAELAQHILIEGRQHLRETEPGTFEVWTAALKPLLGGRSQLVDMRNGHILVQRLPIWLPKVRIDSSNSHSTAGWFDENYLPYRRPGGW